MNIDAYKTHIHAGLRKLEELVVNINDIIESRIEKNLKMVRSVISFLLFYDCFRFFFSTFLIEIMRNVRNMTYVTGIEDLVSGFAV